MPESNMIEYTCEYYSYPPSERVCCHKQFSLDEHLWVPEHKPGIENILEVIACPQIEKTKTIHTPFGKKIIIIGKVEQKIVYSSDAFCHSVHCFESTVPFSVFFENCVIPQPDFHGHACSSCASETRCPGTGGYPDAEHHPAIHPRIMVEYLCARKSGPCEIDKSLVLLVWVPVRDQYHGQSPYTHSQLPVSEPCEVTEPRSECHSCRHASICARAR